MKRLHVAALPVAACLSLLSSPAHAQSVDIYSSQKLAQIQQQLSTKADTSGGLAGVTLQQYPNHYTMLSFRDKDGQGELHEQMADVFFIVDGKATLVTGGHLVNPKTTTPGEIRGDSVQGGTSVSLKKGDVVHIPANVPHQLLVPPGGSFTYFVVKVQK